MQHDSVKPNAIARAARKFANRSAVAYIARRGRAVPAHVVTGVYAAAYARVTRILAERGA